MEANKQMTADVANKVLRDAGYYVVRRMDELRVFYSAEDNAPVSTIEIINNCVRDFAVSILLDEAPNKNKPVRPTSLELGTIDIRMTWAGNLPILLAALDNGTPKGKDIARQELRRMAEAADIGIALLAARAQE